MRSVTRCIRVSAEEKTFRMEGQVIKCNGLSLSTAVMFAVIRSVLRLGPS